MTQNQDFFKTITPISLSSSPDYSGIATSHIAAGNGIFTYAKTKLATKLVKDTNYTINEDLPKLESYIEFNKDLPKIPLEAFYSMLAFYKIIYDKDQTEAQMNFYWNEHNISELKFDNTTIKLDEIKGLKDWGNGLISYVPVQINSAALTSVDDDPIYTELRQQMMPFVETHSHNTMAAFKSSTDEANSYADELQLVIGHITSDKFDFYNWVTIRGKQYDNLDKDIVEQIVELPDEYNNLSLDDLPTIPEEWIDQHSKNKGIKFKHEFDKMDYDYHYADYMYKQANYNYDDDFEPYDDRYKNHSNLNNDNPKQHVSSSFTNSVQEDQNQSLAPEQNKKSLVQKLKSVLPLEKFTMIKNKVKNKIKKG